MHCPLIFSLEDETKVQSSNKNGEFLKGRRQSVALVWEDIGGGKKAKQTFYFLYSFMIVYVFSRF